MEAKHANTKTVVVVAIDPGSSKSGVVVLVNGQIAAAKTSLNEEIVPLVREYLGTKYTLRVMIEDLLPYSLQLTPDVLTTSKFIGELEYRLTVARISFTLITRAEVKKWAYNAYNELLNDMVKIKVRKRSEKKGQPLVNQDGTEKKGSHVWLDDTMIEKSMRLEWSIPAQRGKQNKYGLKTHSFQALALGTLFIKGHLPEIMLARKKAKAEKLKKKLKKKMNHIPIISSLDTPSKTS